MTAGWGQITTGEITRAIQGKLISGRPDIKVEGISTDSRKIKPGQLFWPLKGDNYDGHDFLKTAIEKGAAGAVRENRYDFEIPEGKDPVVITVPSTLQALGDLAGWWRRRLNPSVVAITGSAGKTTTKEMTSSILGLGAKTLKNEGNLNNLVGLPLSLLSLKEDHLRAVLEMGMNKPGEIGRLTEIASPDIGLITNVAKAHLEGLGSVRGVAKAKVELFEKMPMTSQALLNGDDVLLLEVASSLNRAFLTFGLGQRNDIRATKVLNRGIDGLSFELDYHGSAYPVRLRVPGTQNIMNALAASAVAYCLQEPVEHVAEGLNRFEGIEGRFRLIHLPDGSTLLDDTYNANPCSLKAAIDSLRSMVTNDGRVIIGLGEMLELGDETLNAHLEAGRLVAGLRPYYFLVMGDHAREMIEGALQIGMSKGQICLVNSPEEMALKIDEVLQSGDLILLKGSRRMGLERAAKNLLKAHAKEVRGG
ncbi:UDP-N-acetylmuramoyl-tripeptide--D-alanyl-D-alanine ligase [Thermodesulfobacteriota bacterium]